MGSTTDTVGNDHVLELPVVCLLFSDKPSLRSGESSSCDYRFSSQVLGSIQVQVYNSAARFEEYLWIGECYGTSPNMLWRMDSPTSADILTGALVLNSPSPPPPSPVPTLPCLALRLLRFLRFPFQRYLTFPPLIIRLCMLELRRRPSTSRLLAILQPLVSLLPEC